MYLLLASGYSQVTEEHMFTVKLETNGAEVCKIYCIMCRQVGYTDDSATETLFNFKGVLHRKSSI